MESGGWGGEEREQDELTMFIHLLFTADRRGNGRFPKMWPKQRGGTPVKVLPPSCKRSSGRALRLLSGSIREGGRPGTSRAHLFTPSEIERCRGIPAGKLLRRWSRIRRNEFQLLAKLVETGDRDRKSRRRRRTQSMPLNYRMTRRGEGPQWHPIEARAVA
jgi:hypothetical protein